MAPYLYRAIIDSITNFVAQNGATAPDITSEFGREIMGYISLIVLIFLVVRVLYTIADYSISNFQTKTLRDISNYSFEKIIDHSYQFFANSFAGGLVKKAGRFIYSFEDIHDTIVYSVWLPVVRLVSVYIVLFIVSPPLGWMFFVWSIIFIIFSFHYAKRRVPLDLAEAAADSRTTGRTADVYTNVLNLKMFVSRERELAAFNAVTTEQMDARTKAWYYQNFAYLMQGSIVTWLQIMSLYVSVTLWFYGMISLGTIVLAYSFSGTIFDSVWNLGKQMSRMSKSFSNASEIIKDLKLL